MASLIIDRLSKEGYIVIGYPRLVRLNPNIPWKTRGNGAISFQIAKKGKGDKSQIGEIKGKKVNCFSKVDKDITEILSIKNIIEDIVKINARLEDINTNSGFVLINDDPIYGFYKKAVTEIVTLKETKIILGSLNAMYKGYKNSRGLIGATASVAWNNKYDKTYELISYRKKAKWGLERFVDEKSTMKMDNETVSTFDNFDYENKHNRLVPNSPCPVLYGIRGNHPKELKKAKSMIISEDIESWLIFESNQGTDDHLVKKKISEITAYSSVIVNGVLTKTPETIRGGHVIFRIRDKTGEMDCATYEPTKQFRNIIRQLIVGDKIEVYGGVRKKPLTINIEKVYIKHLKKINDKIENPVCKRCGKHMSSMGTGQGFRCKKCRIKSNKPTIIEIKREIKKGFYEVPVCARRHISKPLKRYQP